MYVKDKTIVVTGGGNGVGRQLVLTLLAKGARVAAVDLNENALAETASLAGSKAVLLSTHVANIAERAVVEGLPEQVIARHGCVDGLINNAGIIQPFVTVADLDYTAIERVMHVNFYGSLYMIKSFMPYIIKRSEAHIVNVSSMGGFLPVPGQGIYGASKAAIKLLTEALHSELMDTGVQVTLILPGSMDTSIAANSGVKMKEGVTAADSPVKLTTPQQAAQIIIESMEKNRYRVLIGKDAKFLDLLYRIAPRFAANFIYKQMKKVM